MIGVVAIGRNEGERLGRCLASVLAAGIEPGLVVYVDSGSTDGSPATARAQGVQLVELGASHPFTAARGRNAGFEALLQSTPDLPFIQFIDADCELEAGWLALAEQTLAGDPTLAAVCGRRRERHPDASPYNRLCDIEWNTPIGDTNFGGDVVLRATALQKAGGYDATLIAGEDPDLAERLRGAGWKLLRLDAEMTTHDAALKNIRQWWRRMTRAGHAYAEVSARHRMEPSRFWVKEVRSNWLWGLWLPLAGEALSWPTRGISLGVVACAYLLLWAKIRRSALQRGLSTKDASLYARFTTLAKFPLGTGQMKFFFNRLRGKSTRVMEYKG